MPKITVDESVCKGCGLCANACPLKIISLDTGRCTGCASCAAMCPDTAITVEK